VLRPFFEKLFGDAAEIGLRLTERDAGLQSPHHQESTVPAPGQIIDAWRRLLYHHCRDP